MVVQDPNAEAYGEDTSPTRRFGTCSDWKPRTLET